MRRGILARVAAILGVLFAVTQGSARGEDRYYATVFGSRSHPKLLRYIHTWATFIRVVDGADPARCRVYQHTISWMPATFNVRTWSILPEKGVNLDLYRTLDVVTKQGQGVTMWGPFEMARPAYERSLRVKAILESGKVEYRAISTARDLLISDCIHALAAVDPVFGRGHYPLIRVGKPASRYVARQVMTRSIFDQYRTEAAWLIPRLGLDLYPIEVVAPQRIPKRNCVLCRCPE